MKPYASILFDEPPKLKEKLLKQVSRGFKAIKMGWRPFGRVSRKYDELLIKTARDAVGDHLHDHRVVVAEVAAASARKSSSYVKKSL